MIILTDIFSCMSSSKTYMVTNRRTKKYFFKTYKLYNTIQYRQYRQLKRQLKRQPKTQSKGQPKRQLQRQSKRQPKRQPKIQPERQPDCKTDFQNISRCVKTRQF